MLRLRRNPDKGAAPVARPPARLSLPVLCAKPATPTPDIYTYYIEDLPLDAMTKPPADVALKAAGMLWLGLPQAFVAEACGVTQSTLRSWQRQGWWPEFERQAERGHFDRMVGKARMVLDKTMEAGLHEDACARDRKQAFEAAKFLLENKDDNFRPKPQNVEHRHTHTVAERLNALSDAELKAIAAGRAPLQLDTHEAEDGVYELDFAKLTDESTARARPDKPKQVHATDDGRLILDED